MLLTCDTVHVSHYISLYVPNQCVVIKLLHNTYYVTHSKLNSDFILVYITEQLSMTCSSRVCKPVNCECRVSSEQICIRDMLNAINGDNTQSRVESKILQHQSQRSCHCRQFPRIRCRKLLIVHCLPFHFPPVSLNMYIMLLY